MIFPPDRIAIYLDWRTQEVGIAAASSGDPALMSAYGGGDVYYAFARKAAQPMTRIRSTGELKIRRCGSA